MLLYASGKILEYVSLKDKIVQLIVLHKLIPMVKDLCMHRRLYFNVSDTGGLIGVLDYFVGKIMSTIFLKTYFELGISFR